MYQYYLLAQAERGNIEAFWILVEQCLPALFNKVWLLSGSTGETKLIMAQGLLVAWSQIQAAAKRGAFQSFISRILAETALKRLKKRKTDIQLDSSDQEVTKEADTLLQSVLQLNAPERRLVVLRYLENLTLQEIAALVGKREEEVSEALGAVLSSLAVPD